MNTITSNFRSGVSYAFLGDYFETPEIKRQITEWCNENNYDITHDPNDGYRSAYFSPKLVGIYYIEPKSDDYA